jgi:zinc transport system substrate-binding protein
MRSVAVLAFVGIAFLSGCGGSDESSDPRVKVVAAFYPLAWAAERIGGERFEVANLTPPGAEPHDLELSPRDVETVLDADLVIYVGGGFQPALEDALRKRDGPTLDILPEGEQDPHVWLDPTRFSELAGDIGTVLGRPAAAHELAGELRSLDAPYARELRRCER